ncbi:MAG: HAMP domain-containing histidine kinase [Thermodesulfovibrionales bacterium]|nr:HAMP domain-containing histidine kinase [Thermodesulfovibrionales bacterium]
MHNFFIYFILAIFLILSPADVLAFFLPHDYPAIYIHTTGRVFFFIAMMIIAIYIYRFNLLKEKQWVNFLIAIILFALWDVMVFLGRFKDFTLLGSKEGFEYFKRVILIDNPIDYLFLITRFDFLVLDAGMLFYYLFLKNQIADKLEKKQETLLPFLFIVPYFPIFLTQIVGSIVFVILSSLCLHQSISLYKKDKDNVMWNYMIWFSSSFFAYSISRMFAYFLQHFLISSGEGEYWEIFKPFIGSINTIFFFWIGFVSLFFLMVYKSYLRIQDEENKLQRVNLDLIQLNRELETLVAERTMALMGLTVADKVRNPAVLIGALCKRIVKKEEKLNRDLMDIIDECKKLETIVGEFENLLKSRQNVFEYADLNELINSIIYILEQELTEKQIQLELRLSSQPMRINLQRNLLKAAIYHVIRNSIEATPPGGIITITTEQQSEQIILSIMDTGRGIHKENLEKIFDPFFSTKELRFGMGLPLVKQIVNEHLGELKIESELGKGTTVKMIFPVRWKPQK